MNKRSQRKKALVQTKKKQRKQSKKTQKKQRGGSSSEMESIMLSLLSETYIPFLPTATCVANKSYIQLYLSSVSAYKLLSLIGKKEKYVNSNSISELIDDIDTGSEEIFRSIGTITNIPVSRKVMSKFMINCEKLSRSSNPLHSYILDCEDMLSMKNVHWYHVALGLIPLDDDFENAILQEIKDRKIFIDTDKFKYGLELLAKDKKVKEIFKRRIIQCGRKPQGFFDKLFGTISWDSYNECFQCSENKCTVSLDDNYKAFLNQRHRIKSIDKIKILIYVELRLRALSKHFSLESMRIAKNSTGKVSRLLNKMYLLDKQTGNLSSNHLRQVVMQRRKQEGGGVDQGSPEETTPDSELNEDDLRKKLDELEASMQRQPEMPVSDQQTVEELKQEVTTEEPKQEEPKQEEPKQEEPKQEEPKQEEPKQEEPKQEEPKQEEPKQEESGFLDKAKSLFGLSDKDSNEATVDKATVDKATVDTPTVDEATLDKATEDMPTEDMPTAAIPPSNEEPTDTLNMSERSVLDPQSPPPDFEKLVYITYNGIIGKTGIKQSIADQIKINMGKISKTNNPDVFKVHSIRTGPKTTSVEVEIVPENIVNLSVEEIKNNIVRSVANRSFLRDIVVIELDSVKDIYFDGISKYPELQKLPSQFKRALVELKGKFPETTGERIPFEEKLLVQIKEMLEEPDLNLHRVQLESVSRSKLSDQYVVVQFLIMNGKNEKTIPHDMIMKLKQNYKQGDNDFTFKHGILRIVFGEPSVILDNEGVTTMRSLQQEKNEMTPTDEVTLDKLEKDYKRIAYLGCDITIDNLKHNMITADTPLNEECEQMVQQYLEGP